jgi:hypothetical protein
LLQHQSLHFFDNLGPKVFLTASITDLSRDSFKNEMKGTAVTVHGDQFLRTVQGRVAILARIQFCSLSLRHTRNSPAHLPIASASWLKRLNSNQWSSSFKSQGFTIVCQGKSYFGANRFSSFGYSFQAFVDGSFEVQFAAFATHSHWDIVYIDQFFAVMKGYAPDSFLNYSVTKLANFFIHGSLFSRA